VIVAIESASTDLGIALATPTGDSVTDEAWHSGERGSAELVPRLLALIRRSGRDLQATTGVAVGTGPGSFTGLRVGMSVAKGLAVALGVPIVGVPSLRAWLEAAPGARAAAVRAGASEAYLLGRRETNPVIVRRDELAARAGSTPLVAPAELAEAFGLAAAVSPFGAARAIALAAAERLQVDPAGDDVARLAPVYGRPPRGLGGGRAEGRLAWP
jgi:tRNA threonylcarbamoyladenosine biosynthesis protein TsaB